MTATRTQFRGFLYVVRNERTGRVVGRTDAPMAARAVARHHDASVEFRTDAARAAYVRLVEVFA